MTPDERDAWADAQWDRILDALGPLELTSVQREQAHMLFRGGVYAENFEHHMADLPRVLADHPRAEPDEVWRIMLLRMIEERSTFYAALNEED